MLIAATAGALWSAYMIMMLYQAVQAANATKGLLALGNSETLPQPAPPPSPAALASAPVVRA